MSWVGVSLPYRPQAPIIGPQKYRMDILVPIHPPPLYIPVEPLYWIFFSCYPWCHYEHYIFPKWWPPMMLFSPLIFLGCLSVMFLLGHIYLLSLFSTMVEISLSMCVGRSDVSSVHQSMSVTIPPMFTALYLAGYSFNPHLWFFHFRLKYFVYNGAVEGVPRGVFRIDKFLGEGVIVV